MNNYKIKGHIGRGAQGVVCLCEKSKLKKKNGKVEQFAMKRILTTDFNEANEAMKELLLIKDLHHPGIVKYHDLFLYKPDNDITIFVCIVMEYFELGDLDAFVDEYIRKNEKLIPEEKILDFLTQICECVAYMHENGRMHRDMKPQNIFVKKVGKKFDLKIGDFGLVTQFNQKSLKSTFCGSPTYISPELIRGKKYSEKIDCYSIGVIGYKLCTGKDRSFQFDLVTEYTKTRREVWEALGDTYSDYLIEFLFLMLETEPEKRLSAKEAVSYLKDYEDYERRRKKVNMKYGKVNVRDVKMFVNTSEERREHLEEIRSYERENEEEGEGEMNEVEEERNEEEEMKEEIVKALQNNLNVYEKDIKGERRKKSFSGELNKQVSNDYRKLSGGSFKQKKLVKPSRKNQSRSTRPAKNKENNRSNVKNLQEYSNYFSNQMKRSMKSLPVKPPISRISRRRPSPPRREHDDKLMIRIGSFYKELQQMEMKKSKSSGKDLNYEWTLYVRTDDARPEKFIEKITLKLHETFSPSDVVLKKPPYEVTRKGWGTFSLPVKVFFHKKLGIKTLNVVHILDFSLKGTENSYKDYFVDVPRNIKTKVKERRVEQKKMKLRKMKKRKGMSKKKK